VARRALHWVLGAVCAGVAITALTQALPPRAAFEKAGAHAVIGTASGLIAALGAYVLAGRARRTGSRAEVGVTLALAVMAAVELAFVAVPVVTARSPAGSWAWSALVGRLLSAGLLAASACLPDRAITDAAVVLRRGLAVVGALLVTLGAIGWGLEQALPSLVRGAHAAFAEQALVEHPAVRIAQVVGVVLGVLAAVGFAMQTRHRSDHLVPTLAAMAILLAFARMNYLEFPSLYSDWVYSGDLLRLVAMLLVARACLVELGARQRTLTWEAARGERRRIARDMHDGLTQELTYIASQARRLDGSGDERVVRRIRTAAERALQESRAAVSAFARPNEPPLSVALAEAAETTANHFSTRLELRLAQIGPVAAENRQALLRILHEAFGNAARHGKANTVWVTLEVRDSLVLRIEDDGRGFDTDSAAQPGGFGLISMRERAQALGGELRVSSAVGHGTTVEVRCPAETYASDPT
jgi:signal transduction histidine kinase